MEKLLCVVNDPAFFTFTRKSFPRRVLDHHCRGQEGGTIKIQEEEAPVMLIEVRMPQMDGIETLRVGKMEGFFPFEAYQHGFVLCLASIGLSFFISLLRKRRISI